MLLCPCFPHSSVGKESACNAGDLDSSPGSGRSPGEGNGNLLQHCLENPMDRGAWWAIVYGVAWAGHSLVTKPPPLPLSMKFPRQEYWSGLPFPSPGVDKLLTRSSGWNKPYRELHSPSYCCLPTFLWAEIHERFLFGERFSIRESDFFLVFIQRTTERFHPHV